MARNGIAPYSRALASSLGEQRGRTTSRVMGTGISRLTGGALSPNTGLDIAHLAMITAVAVPKARGPIAVGLLLAFAAGLR